MILKMDDTPELRARAKLITEYLGHPIRFLEFEKYQHLTFDELERMVREKKAKKAFDEATSSKHIKK